MVPPVLKVFPEAPWATKVPIPSFQRLPFLCKWPWLWRWNRQGWAPAKNTAKQVKKLHPPSGVFCDPRAPRFLIALRGSVVPGHCNRKASRNVFEAPRPGLAPEFFLRELSPRGEGGAELRSFENAMRSDPAQTTQPVTDDDSTLDPLHVVAGGTENADPSMATARGQGPGLRSPPYFPL